jgi:hypothetical protein
MLTHGGSVRTATVRERNGFPVRAANFTVRERTGFPCEQRTATLMERTGFPVRAANRDREGADRLEPNTGEPIGEECGGVSEYRHVHEL